MTAKVAVVEFEEDVYTSFKHALKLIGEIDDLNTTKRTVVVKLGVFDHKTEHHATPEVVSAIINSFNKAPKIFLAESDNYKGTGSERLQVWKQLFNNRVAPFNLSDDKETREVKITDEKMGFSHIIFKPNVLVSAHVLRQYDKGSVLKNLLGLIPDRKKVRFHKKLEPALLDAYEAIGGIDLAVIDGTYTYPNVAPKLAPKRVKTNVLLVGRDAIAVEAVGATLVGLNSEKMPLLQEAMKRSLGEGNIEKIKVLGNSIRSIKERFRQQVA